MLVISEYEILQIKFQRSCLLTVLHDHLSNYVQLCQGSGSVSVKLNDYVI